MFPSQRDTWGSFPADHPFRRAEEIMNGLFPEDNILRSMVRTLTPPPSFPRSRGVRIPIQDGPRTPTFDHRTRTHEVHDEEDKAFQEAVRESIEQERQAQHRRREAIAQQSRHPAPVINVDDDDHLVVEDLDEVERRALEQALWQSKEEERKREEKKKQEEIQKELERAEQEAAYYNATQLPTRVDLVEDDEETELEHALRASMMMEERRLQDEENERNRQLREEQDRAFHESLLQDQERERLQQEEITKQELEAQQKEDEEAIKLSIELNKQKRCEDIAKRLPAEPAAQDPNTTHIVVRMPTGDRLERRFLTTDKLQLLKDFVESKSYEYQLPAEYEIVNTFPKQTFSDLHKTFAEVGLVGRSLVAVQPL